MFLIPLFFHFLPSSCSNKPHSLCLPHAPMFFHYLCLPHAPVSLITYAFPMSLCYSLPMPSPCPLVSYYLCLPHVPKFLITYAFPMPLCVSFPMSAQYPSVSHYICFVCASICHIYQTFFVLLYVSFYIKGSVQNHCNNIYKRKHHNSLVLTSWHAFFMTLNISSPMLFSCPFVPLINHASSFLYLNMNFLISVFL